MLNAVGLQNKGVDYLVEHIYPRIKDYDTALVVNVSGRTVEDYAAVCERLRPLDKIAAVEINISCPNVKQGGMSWGTTTAGCESVVSACRRAWDRTMIVKLTPNVTDISTIARACEDAGADGISLINTLLGMRINLKTKRPVLANTTGGLSGPAVFPVALRMVWQVYEAVGIPIVGIGGIDSAEKVIEMMLAGATCVEVGAANLRDPFVCPKIIEALPEVLDRYGIESIAGLTGAAHR